MLFTCQWSCVQDGYMTTIIVWEVLIQGTGLGLPQVWYMYMRWMDGKTDDLVKKVLITLSDQCHEIIELSH